MINANHILTVYNDCIDSPCGDALHSCIDGVQSYICVCHPGFTGVNCETDMDECQTNACENEATCVDAINGYICQCLSGYRGQFCETEIGMALRITER